MISYAIIPARMGSTRFPGKPLAPIHAVPMLGHVAYRTAMAPSLAATYVATCDAEIFDYCQEHHIKVVMTDRGHTRCSDRCAEALPLIEKLEGKKADAMVMVQGDEPMVHPQMIEAALSPLQSNVDVQVVNLQAPILSEAEFTSPNTIKVISDAQGKALYFSRAPIPHRGHGTRDNAAPYGYKQVCIIPFRPAALHNFMSLGESALERAESIDMLRLLEHGFAVHMVHTPFQNQAVDCPADLERVVQLMQDDDLRHLYS